MIFVTSFDQFRLSASLLSVGTGRVVGAHTHFGNAVSKSLLCPPKIFTRDELKYAVDRFGRWSRCASLEMNVGSARSRQWVQPDVMSNV